LPADFIYEQAMSCMNGDIIECSSILNDEN